MSLYDGYRITSPYGPRKDPFTGQPAHHTGIDLAKSHKEPIYAFLPGEVVHAREGVVGTGFGGFGIVVAIKDIRGALHCYAHLDMAAVKVGQQVMAGQMIGRQGTTGRSTGSHLHYEVRTKSSPSYGFGADTDPTRYLEQHLPKAPVKIDEEEVDVAKIEALEKEIQSLKNELKAVKDKQAVTKAPDWFTKEFGKDALTGLVDDQTGDYGFWRSLAVVLRIYKIKK